MKSQPGRGSAALSKQIIQRAAAAASTVTLRGTIAKHQSGRVRIQGARYWFDLPAAPPGNLKIGDIVDFVVDKDGSGQTAHSVTPTNTVNPHVAATEKHPDLSAKIDLRNDTLVAHGPRITSHENWATTEAYLRTGPAVKKTLSETLGKNGWVYSVDFSSGAILFEYDEKTKTAYVFHSMKTKSG